MQTRAKNNRIGLTRYGKAYLARFARDEDGALLIFGVYVFLIILMIGGIGVDLMHYERNRSQLQYTLDRAVLAAADLDQTLTPYEVVADYFTKSGLGEYLSSVVVQEGEGFRIVSGTADAQIDMQFMQMTGIDSLSANAASTAEERIDGIEISLILDVSGSMNSNNRLTNLKVAARDFIDQMFANTEEGKLSISIIPYATQVSVPQELFDEYNMSQEHNYSRCVNFQSADFNQTAIDTNQAYDRTMHFDVWYYADRRANPNTPLPAPVCDGRASREIMVMENDPDTLKAFISGLSASGNTSIDIGMKWGTALIDPAMNPVIVSLIGNGHVAPEFATRPSAFNDTDALKVIVLMTDGQNTSQYFIEDEYRSGPSEVWWNAEEERYSLLDENDPNDPDDDEYFWPHDRSFEDHPYGDEEDGVAVNISYPDLWAFTSVAWNAYYNYRYWIGTSNAFNKWYYPVFDYVNASTKNTRTKAICDTAKAEQVIVFTIGFEAPASGQTVLADCASSPSHFFDVDGLEISDAFASIASSIRKLRLTQ